MHFQRQIEQIATASLMMEAPRDAFLEFDEMYMEEFGATTTHLDSVDSFYSSLEEAVPSTSIPLKEGSQKTAKTTPVRNGVHNTARGRSSSRSSTSGGQKGESLVRENHGQSCHNKGGGEMNLRESSIHDVPSPVESSDRPRSLSSTRRKKSKHYTVPIKDDDNIHDEFSSSPQIGIARFNESFAGFDLWEREDDGNKTKVIAIKESPRDKRKGTVRQSVPSSSSHHRMALEEHRVPSDPCFVLRRAATSLSTRRKLRSSDLSPKTRELLSITGHSRSVPNLGNKTVRRMPKNGGAATSTSIVNQQWLINSSSSTAPKKPPCPTLLVGKAAMHRMPSDPCLVHERRTATSSSGRKMSSSDHSPRKTKKNDLLSTTGHRSVPDVKTIRRMRKGPLSESPNSVLQSWLPSHARSAAQASSSRPASFVSDSSSKVGEEVNHSTSKNCDRHHSRKKSEGSHDASSNDDGKTRRCRSSSRERVGSRTRTKKHHPRTSSSPSSSTGRMLHALYQEE